MDFTTLVVIDTDSIGSCKSTTTTVPCISYRFDYYMRFLCVWFFFFFYLFLMEQNVIASFSQYWQCRNIHVRIQIFSVSLLLLSRLDTFISINACFQKTEFDFGIFIRERKQYIQVTEITWKYPQFCNEIIFCCIEDTILSDINLQSSNITKLWYSYIHFIM